MCSKIGLLFCMFMAILVNLELFSADQAFAEEKKQENAETRVVRNQTLASNPECGLSSAIGIAAGTAIVAGTGLLIGAVAAYVTGFMTTGALIMGGIGAATLAGGVLGMPLFFACMYSFVRHPIFRASVNDGTNLPPGTPIQCKDPSPPFPSCANSTFQTMQEYYMCIGNGNESDGKRKEPRCLDREFVDAGSYQWPKNRTVKSDYIEVCYRMPLAPVPAPPVLLGSLVVNTTEGKDRLDPRELDYGDDNLHNAKMLLGLGVKCKVLRDGESANIHTVKFKAYNEGGNICVFLYGWGDMPFATTPKIGCHMREVGPPAPMCAASEPILENGKVVNYDNSKCYGCYIAPACRGNSGLHSFAIMPITSTIMECLRETLTNMLNGTCVDAITGQTREGFLKVAQRRLSTAVQALLILALMLFTLKFLLGGVQGTPEIYVTILKFAVVFAFTQSELMGKYYDMLIELSSGMSDLVLSAGGNKTVCDFKASEYVDQTTGENFAYLAMWDRLDCRLAFYLGQSLTGSQLGTMFALILLWAVFPIALLFAAVFGYQVLLCAFSMFYCVMLLSVILWIVYLAILSMVLITVLAMLSPLFIPMCLFQVTKGFFDGWVKELMTYTLYPVILFAFLGLMFAVFDKLYLGDLTFKREIKHILVQDRTNFVLADPDACSKPEFSSTLACMVQKFALGEQTIIFGVSLPNAEFDKATTEDAWKRLGMLLLVLAFFYHFLSTLGNLAAELSGNYRGDLSRGVSSPASMIKAIASKPFQAAQMVRSAAKAARKKGSESKDKEGKDDSGSVSSGDSSSGGDSGGGGSSGGGGGGGSSGGG